MDIRKGEDEKDSLYFCCFVTSSQLNLKHN